jgi:hypothetical protein
MKKLGLLPGQVRSIANAALDRIALDREVCN